MMFSRSKVIFFVVFWTNYVQGYGEEIFSIVPGQFEPAGAAGAHEAIFSFENTDKNWLSLGPSSSRGEPISKRLKSDIESSKLPSEKPVMSTDLVTNSLRKKRFGSPQLNDPSAFKNLRSICQAEKFKFLPIHQIKDGSTSATLYSTDSNPAPFANSRLKAIQTTSNERQGTLVGFPSTTIDPRIRQTSAAGNKAIVSKTTSTIQKNEKEVFFEKYKIENLSKNTSKKFYSIQKSTERNLKTSKLKFEKSLMKILDPKSPLINSDLIQNYASKVESLKSNLLKNSMTNVLSFINEHIETNKRRHFYLKHDEVIEFLSIPYMRSFKIKYDAELNLKSDIYYRNFLTDIKNSMVEMNFKYLIAQFYKITSTNDFPIFNLDYWGENNKYFTKIKDKKQYVGKLFTSYSILINKIFCDGVDDGSFMNRQLEAFKFYTLVNERFEEDDQGKVLFTIESLKSLDASLGIEKNLGSWDSILVEDFNKSFECTNSRERSLFFHNWVVIKLWLSRCRPQLYEYLRCLNTFDNSFKPFVNSFFQIIMQIS
ncbi:expressed protein, partial [Phakopsora pachyrhizi]